MSGFEEREKAFEAKYKHDEALKFKIEARQARLFGQHVAGELGLSGEEAESYAKTMVTANLEEAGTDDMMRKAEADLTENGKTFDKVILQKHLDECFATARTQIMMETDD
ncbi:MAG: DUF1476 domain-containing protein [Alphaproteobacteria bacterium]